MDVAGKGSWKLGDGALGLRRKFWFGFDGNVADDDEVGIQKGA